MYSRMRITRKEKIGTNNLHRSTSMKLKFIRGCPSFMHLADTPDYKQKTWRFDQLRVRRQLGNGFRPPFLLELIFTLCRLLRGSALVSYDDLYHLWIVPFLGSMIHLMALRISTIQVVQERARCTGTANMYPASNNLLSFTRFFCFEVSAEIFAQGSELKHRLEVEFHGSLI